LWSDAAARNKLPKQDAIYATLARVGPDKLAIDDSSARKTVAGVEVSLGAVAKGYAVHQAITVMQRYGLRAALVDVGGDMECFGTPLDSNAWSIGVQNPWSDGDALAVISPDRRGYSLAVCTSGSYRRYYTIEGRRYSHIIDPRTGLPADTWCSVTVIAPDAMTADGWATALSVLGAEKGLKVIGRQRGIEAMFVSGSQQEPTVRLSPGFRKFIKGCFPLAERPPLANTQDS
jgi:thiamine biosynthesis lipoprotein